MNTVFIEIVTPIGLIFSGNIKAVTFPGSEGEFGVLPGHASLVTSLKAGIIDVFIDDNKREAIAINWGYVKVEELKITVLLDGAVAIGGDSDSNIAKSLEKAKTLIESMGNSDATIAIAKVDTMARNLKSYWFLV